MTPTSDAPAAATGDPADILGRLPLDAQLLLRDHIAGLAAEAGSARAAAARSERVRRTETDILIGKLASARSERDDALARVAELTDQLRARDIPVPPVGIYLRRPGR